MENVLKKLAVKDYLGSFSAVIALAGYLIYYLYLDRYGIKLNELFFVITALPIAILFGITFTITKSNIAKTLLLYGCLFYSILVTMYIVSWIMMGQPYGYIKEALIAGLFIDLIYATWKHFKS